MAGIWSIVVTTADDVESELINFGSLSCQVVDEEGTAAPEYQVVAPADLFQRQRARPRYLTLLVSSAKRESRLSSLKATLSTYLTPDIVGDSVPLKLRYTLGSAVWELLVYYAPLPLDMQRRGPPQAHVASPDILLRFVSYDQSWVSTTATTQSISMLATLSSVGYVLLRSLAGVWSAPSGGPAEDVTALYYASATALYAGTSIGNVWLWNGTSWSQLGSALGGAAEVAALLLAPDGVLYAAGGFTGFVKSWNGSVWATVGTLGSAAYALAIFSDASLYVGTAASGYVRRWNGSAWSTPGTGLATAIKRLVFGPDGVMYGGFGAGVVRLVSGAWLTISVAYDVTAMSFLADGRLAVGHTSGLALWNGVSWTDLVVTGEVDALLDTTRGLVLLGAFSVAGGVTLWSEWAIRRGGTFFSGEVDCDTHRDPYVLAGLSDGRLAVGLQAAVGGAATVYTMKQYAITITGTAASYPTITITYPTAFLTGQLWSIVNVTSGEELHFDSLKIQKGETITIDCVDATVTSDYRGDLSSTVRSGSTALRLLPYVVNNLLLNGDALFTASLKYYPRYVTLDSIE
jgi:hypothetical protein